PFSELIIVFSFLMTAFLAFGLSIAFVDRMYDAVVQFLLTIIHSFADVDFLFSENIAMNLAEVIILLGVIYRLRFVILKMNFKNTARLIMGVLVFLMVRTGCNIYENYREEVLVHSLYRQKIFSVKKGNTACFWMRKNIDKQ